MYTLQMLQADSNAYDDSIIIAKSDGIRLTVNNHYRWLHCTYILFLHTLPLTPEPDETYMYK